MPDDDTNPIQFFKNAAAEPPKEPSPELQRDIERARTNSDRRERILDAMNNHNPLRIAGERVHAVMSARERRSLGKQLGRKR